MQETIEEGYIEEGYNDYSTADKEVCETAGGTYKEFSNGCVDSCTEADSTMRMCTQALAYGCDCGNEMCWNGTSCEANLLADNGVVDDSSIPSESPEDATSVTESYQSCLESQESASSSSIQTITIGLKDDVDLENFISDYNLEPDTILSRLKMIDYTVEKGTQADWICLFLENDRVDFAELELTTTID